MLQQRTEPSWRALRLAALLGAAGVAAATSAVVLPTTASAAPVPAYASWTLGGRAGPTPAP